MKLVVVAGNDDALRFYERLGIKPVLIELAPLEPEAADAGPI